jgi:hypothetical protein
MLMMRLVNQIQAQCPTCLAASPTGGPAADPSQPRARIAETDAARHEWPGIGGGGAGASDSMEGSKFLGGAWEDCRQKLFALIDEE